jgi:hypothetical protein
MAKKITLTETFKKLLASGNIPNTYTDLVKESSKFPPYASLKN